MAWNVLILGGGFGGLYAARKLERALPPRRDTSELGQLGHPPELEMPPAAGAAETVAR